MTVKQQKPAVFNEPVQKQRVEEKSKKVVVKHTYGSVDALFFAYGGHAERGSLRHRVSAAYMDGRTRGAAVGGYVTI